MPVSSVGPPISITRKGPDNCHGEDAMFHVLLLQKPPVMQIESSLIHFKGELHPKLKLSNLCAISKLLTLFGKIM